MRYRVRKNEDILKKFTSKNTIAEPPTTPPAYLFSLPLPRHKNMYRPHRDPDDSLNPRTCPILLPRPLPIPIYLMLSLAFKILNSTLLPPRSGARLANMVAPTMQCCLVSGFRQHLSRRPHVAGQVQREWRMVLCPELQDFTKSAQPLGRLPPRIGFDPPMLTSLCYSS